METNSGIEIRANNRERDISQETTLNFTLIEPKPEFIAAAQEYDSFWKQDGKRILDTFKEITGYSYPENNVRVIVYDGYSYTGLDESTPIHMRYSYPFDAKKAALIHELGHRHLFGVDTGEYDGHQVLDLFLYDVWTKLYGKEFAENQVKVESGRKGLYNYEGTWQWALSKTPEERKVLLDQILQNRAGG